jgi:hypothetical protein
MKSLYAIWIILLAFTGTGFALDGQYTRAVDYIVWLLGTAIVYEQRQLIAIKNEIIDVLRERICLLKNRLKE